MSAVLPELERALVAAARPGAAPVDVSPGAGAGARARGARRRLRGSRRRPVFVLAVPALALVVGVVLVVALGGGSSSRSVAAAYLERFAQRTAAGVSTPTRPVTAGTDWYTDSVTAMAQNWVPPDEMTGRYPPIGPVMGEGYAGHGVLLRRIEQHVWTPSRGQMLEKGRPFGPPIFYGTPAERGVWERLVRGAPQTAGGAEAGMGFGGFMIGDEPGTYSQLQALPTRPAALMRRVGDHWAVRQNSLAWRRLVGLTSLLSEPIPAAVRVADYRALAQLPGMLYLGRVHDPLGRTGEGFAFDSTANSGRPFHRISRIRSEVIFASSTGTLLATENLLLHPPPRSGLPDPLPIYWTAYRSAQVVSAKTAPHLNPPPLPRLCVVHKLTRPCGARRARPVGR